MQHKNDDIFKRIRYTLGIDVDPAVLNVARENADNLEVDIDFLLSNIEILNTSPSLSKEEEKSDKNQHKPFDVVIMNPPFGTKNAGIDALFLEKALQVHYLVIELIQEYHNFRWRLQCILFINPQRERYFQYLFLYLISSVFHQKSSPNGVTTHRCCEFAMGYSSNVQMSQKKIGRYRS